MDGIGRVPYLPMRWWKILGLAGLVAVAIGASAGAVKVQRDRREYADADPVELRDRLRARFTGSSETVEEDAAPTGD